MLARLLNYAETSRDYFATSSVGYGDNKNVDLTRRRSTRLTKLGELENELRHALGPYSIAVYVQAARHSTVRAYLIELEVVAHSDGAFFARHHDTIPQPNSATQRVISAVYYFHKVPKSFTGGVLRLHSIAAIGIEGSFVDIEPTNDTLIFFPSWFPHEVLPVACPTGRFEDSRFAEWHHRRNGAPLR